jgi:Protein of unknown function (DUF938)
MAPIEEDPRLDSPAAQRNRGPLLAELQRLLPPTGTALEVASGTGQHAAWFAAGLPGWQWQPTETAPRLLASISAWCQGLPNVQPPLPLDVLAPEWAGVPMQADAVFCANMVHISPWSTCAALMQGAARHAAPAAQLLLYGPFIVEGVATAESNLAFNADLRQRDPAWGLRRLGDVAGEALAAGWHLAERVAMPANNLLLVFRRGTASRG